MPVLLYQVWNVAEYVSKIQHVVIEFTIKFRISNQEIYSK